MPDVHYLSASQVQLYRDCKRKWAFKHLAHIETPQNASAALGTEVDDTQLQPYLRDGRPFDYTRESGYIAAAGLSFLPEPKAHGLLVQKPFELPSPSWRTHGFAYRGFIDLWMPDSRAMSALSEHVGRDAHTSSEAIPLVCDFKTTSNLKWKKSEQELLTDVQGVMYATHALYETRAKAVDLKWIYFQTKKPYRSVTTNVRIEQEQALSEFLKIDETGKEIMGVKVANADPLSLPPTPSMCNAYGGCPHTGRCNLSPIDILEAQAAQATRLVQLKKGPTTMGTAELLASLKAKRTAVVPGEAPAPPVAAPAPVALPAWATAKVDPLVAAQVRTGPINPPEAALPPAPPTSEVKAKRGRPAKATAGQGNVEDRMAAQLDATERDASIGADAGQGVITVTATWGKEVYQLQPYCPIEIGPFEATGYVLKGETVPQAIGRIYGQLRAFAHGERDRKLAAVVGGAGK